MTGRMIGCGCYILLGICCVIFGIWLMIVKRDEPMGFWANVKDKPRVDDIKGYHRAVGKLWCAYGVVVALLGWPLLGGTMGWITILGTCWASIGLMVIYSVVILKKYERK